MIRTGIGFDVHRFAAGRRLVLGGVTFDHPQGLEGHSDADVLCHALADALLGAVAAGDIGQHFPDTDAAWKDANSVDLLRKVADIVRDRNARILNVDATVIAQKPRLAPHVSQMRANLEDALGIPADRIGIKATTSERLGALGREEGIAVMAIATVDQSGTD
jgi:2-C-methyl-D-erythritol 2,4-cyclodiphosphate synthase